MNFCNRLIVTVVFLLLNIATGCSSEKEDWNSGDGVRGIAISPDGKLLAVSADDSCDVWRIADKKKLHTFSGSHFTVPTFDDKSRRLSVAMLDGAVSKVSIFDLTSEKTVKWTAPESHSILGLVSSSGLTCVRTVKIEGDEWTSSSSVLDVESGKTKISFPDAEHAVTCSDGTFAVTVSVFGRVSRRSLKDGEVTKSFRTAAIISSIAISKSGKKLAVYGKKIGIRVYNIDGDLLFESNLMKDNLLRMSFVDDNRLIGVWSNCSAFDLNIEHKKWRDRLLLENTTAEFGDIAIEAPNPLIALCRSDGRLFILEDPWLIPKKP